MTSEMKLVIVGAVIAGICGVMAAAVGIIPNLIGNDSNPSPPIVVIVTAVNPATSPKEDLATKENVGKSPTNTPVSTPTNIPNPPTSVPNTPAPSSTGSYPCEATVKAANEGLSTKVPARDGPDGKIINYVNVSQKVTIVANRGDWYSIQDAGWLIKDNLTFSQSCPK